MAHAALASPDGEGVVVNEHSSIFGLSQRLPPANLEAEQALLGALLANNRAFDRVAAFLQPDHFADPVHGRIYAAIQRRIEAGQVADAVTLRAEFEHNGLLDDAGGPGYLAQLLAAMVGVINAGEYGRVIHDAWLRRALIEAGERIVNNAFGAEPELDAKAQLAKADEALLALSSDGGGSGGDALDGNAVGRSLLNDVSAAMERQGGLAGLTYGLAGLDRMTGGLRRGQLVTIGGKTSMGKTALALRVAVGAARAGGRVLFVAAEMLSQAIMARAVCAEAGLPLKAYTAGAVEGPDGRLRSLSQAEYDALAAATRDIGDLPIRWDHHSRTVQQVRTQARKMQRAKGGGLDLIVVDYLTRLEASRDAQKSGTAHTAITELMKGLKDTAMSLQVPLVLMVQLSRKLDGREEKTPQMGDMRESGSIEEESDTVMFVHRPHYYLIRSKPERKEREKAADFEQRILDWEGRCHAEKGRALVLIAKQRQGPIGPVRLRFDDRNAQFSDDEGEA
jgi:replicative DNA helicase